MNDNEVTTPSFNQPREWLLWTVATAGGWLLGSLGNFAASLVLSATGLGATLNIDPSQIDQSTVLLLMGISLVMLLIVGLAVGALQELILRRRVPGLSRWALFTGLGFALGSFVFLAFMGLGVGLLQWLLLRRDLSKTGWWPVMSAVAWPLGYMLGGSIGAALGTAINTPIVGGLLGATLTGAIIGAVTGAVLLWLLRQNQVLLDGLREEAAQATQ
jgi:MFS family permease